MVWKKDKHFQLQKCNKLLIMVIVFEQLIKPQLMTPPQDHMLSVRLKSNKVEKI